MGGISHTAAFAEVLVWISRAMCGVTVRWSAPSATRSAPPARRMPDRILADIRYLSERGSTRRTGPPPRADSPLIPTARPRGLLLALGWSLLQRESWPRGVEAAPVAGPPGRSAPSPRAAGWTA